MAYENYKVTYVTITEKLSVTTDKGQKHGHFWKIKKIPQDAILRPKKETTSGKPRTYRKPFHKVNYSKHCEDSRTTDTV